MSGQRFSRLAVIASLAVALGVLPVLPAVAGPSTPYAEAAGFLGAAWSWLTAPFTAPAPQVQPDRRSNGEARLRGGLPSGEPVLDAGGAEAWVGRATADEGTHMDPDG